MNSQTKQALETLKPFKSSDDMTVYEVFKSKKNSFIFNLFDMLLNQLLTPATVIIENQLYYLIASAQEGYRT